MKTDKYPLFIFIGFVIFYASSCKNTEPKTSSQDLFANSKTVELEGGNTTMKIPSTFEKSSRYRLQQDIPRFNSDSMSLLVTQKNLEMLEFEDSDIDIFVDSVSKFHHIIIIDFEQTPLSKQTAAFLNSDLTNSFKNLDESFPQISIEKLESTLRRNDQLTCLKFKFKINNLIDNTYTHYRTVYFLTSAVKSYVIYESSEYKEDLGDYLWTLKDI